MIRSGETRNQIVARQGARHAAGSHGHRARRARRALVRHLQPPAQRADRLPRLGDRRRGREPRGRPASAPRVRRPRSRHRDVHQLPRRRRVRRPRDLRHDALHQARRRDRVLRHRDVDGLAAARGRRRGQAVVAPERPRADPPTPRRLPGPEHGHRDPRPRGDRAPAPHGGDLLRAHRQADPGDQRRARARPLLHPRAGEGLRADRQDHERPRQQRSLNARFLHIDRPGRDDGRAVGVVDDTARTSSPVIERMLELVDERMDSERAPILRAFVREYMRRVEGEAHGRDAEALLNETLGVFELAASRDGAPVAVRAFNPVPAEHGYATRGTVLETNTEDLPFLVDSVSAELEARGIGIVRIVHPIIGTERDARGRIVAVRHPREASAIESVMHFELDRTLGPEELAGLEDATRRVIEDVRHVVRDHAAMRLRMNEMIDLAKAAKGRYDEEEVSETVAFLRWLLDESFIFLGARDYEVSDGQIRVVHGSGLGLLADCDDSAYAKPVALDSLEPDLRDRIEHGDLLIVSKSNRLSPVHRHARMDYIGVRKSGPDGSTAGESRMLGLFTTKAYAEPASQSPLLNRKLRAVLAAEDLIEGSHDYKAAVSLFDSFPKDELLAAPVDDLRGAVIALLGGAGPDRVRVLGRRHPDGRGASVIVDLPKPRYDADQVARVRDLIAGRVGARSIDTHEVLGEGERVQLHFTAHAPDGVGDLDLPTLQRDVSDLTRTWDDRAREALVAANGERGRVLAARWAKRLPASYKAAVEPAAAAGDIAALERLFTSGQPFLVALRNEGELTRIGLYRVGGKLELSRAMPMLEHLGLRVIEERPTRLAAGGETWLQDFGVLGPTDRPLDLDEAGERIAECIAAVWRGDAESDSLNRLVVTTGMDWRQVAILRAYRKYRQRLGSRFTEGYQHDVIAANPHITERQIRLFELRFDPARERDREGEEHLRDQILEDLDAVASLDHDRILRNQLGLIEATVRTNAYRSGRRALSFKVRSADVPAMPQPPPLFEICVYAPEVEGIHLRGGKSARGGIRWSDRMDYRTEVFGLMRAQMTKNAVIVPDGAKGGFHLRDRPEDPAELRAEVERQYVTYVSGLLDVTDNLVDGEVGHPEGG